MQKIVGILILVIISVFLFILFISPVTNTLFYKGEKDRKKIASSFFCSTIMVAFFHFMGNVYPSNTYEMGGILHIYYGTVSVIFLIIISLLVTYSKIPIKIAFSVFVLPIIASSVMVTIIFPYYFDPTNWVYSWSCPY